MSKYKVFVIQPFENSSLKLFEKIKEEFGEEVEFINSNEILNNRLVIDDIIGGIESADCIIADLTGNNPNVFYELGICHTFGKKVIHITRNINSLPFDISAYRTCEYSVNFWEINIFMKKLKELLGNAKNDKSDFGNPVSDYRSKESSHNCLHKNESNEQLSQENKNSYGEIRKETNSFFEYNKIKQHDFGVNMNRIEYDIEQVQNSSLPSKKIDKVQEQIDKFAKDMSEYNNKMYDDWSKINDEIIFLIDNNQEILLDDKEKNKKWFRNFYLNVENILSNHDSHENFIKKCADMGGVNEHFKKTILDLSYIENNYTKFLNLLVASTDRIMNKVEKIIGDIDLKF